MRDYRTTIELLEAKAQNAAVTAPEREAIYTKIEGLRERHEEPVLQTGGAMSPPKPPRPPAPPSYSFSFNFGSGEGNSTGTVWINGSTGINTTTSTSTSWMWGA